MNKEKKLEILKHILLITKLNELTWDISDSIFNNPTEQNFIGVCKTYKLHCKIKFNNDNTYNYIFVSIDGSNSADSNFSVYGDESDIVSEICNEIIKKTEFKPVKEKNPFDDLLNNTGVSEIRNKKISFLLSEEL